ncbi:ankyrin repeat domain-containing protein [Aspergillus undulatus]|uniref:ankyrin repeat domain-containing protein n=1 Tax=Aspergillus undulatus TaxID=1810928 RepID=UPI003CCE1201
MVRSPIRHCQTVLLENIDVGQALETGGDTDLLLCAAAACGLDTIVHDLLQRGCNPNARLDGVAAFECACRYGHQGPVKLLLDHGAIPSGRALAGALRCQSVPIVRLLLDAGIDPRDCPYGYLQAYSALGLVAGHEALFELLHERGGDPKDTFVPELHLHNLMKAVLESGVIRNVQMLLDRGHRIKGRFAYDALRNNIDFLELLTSATKAGLVMLEFFFSLGFKEVPIIDYGKHNIESPLNAAKDIIELKLLPGKGVIPPSSSQMAFILSGLFSDHPFEEALETLDMLLSRGASINAQNTPKRIYLPCGAIWGVSGQHANPRALEAVLARGANPLQLARPDRPDSLSALEVAMSHGNAEGVAIDAGISNNRR